MSYVTMVGMTDEEIEDVDPLYVRERPPYFNRDVPKGTWWWQPGRRRRATYMGKIKGDPLVAFDD